MPDHSLRRPLNPRRGAATVQPGGPLPAVGEVPPEIAALGPDCVAVYERVTAESRGLRAILGAGDVEGLSIYCSACDRERRYQAAIDDPTGGEYEHLPPGARVQAAAGCRVIRERFLREWTRRLQGHQARSAEGPKPAGRARGRLRGTGSGSSSALDRAGQGSGSGSGSGGGDPDDVPWSGGRVQ